MAPPDGSSVLAYRETTSRYTEVRRAFVGGTYWWNYPTVRGLFTSPAGAPVFCPSIDEAIVEAARHGGRVVAWAARLTRAQEERCAAGGIELQRIEDGFIRSVGLGAGFAGAASLAVDRRGIYYDATRPSDLEHLLETIPLSDGERAEGARIRQRIVELRLSKYNLHGSQSVVLNAGGRRMILVPGQVSDDASILNSMARTIDPQSTENINAQLLRQARARNPDAYLVYKPHPDVLCGLRKGHVPPEETRSYADAVVDNIDISELIGLCDGVETITSLVGFEALLRLKPVTVHGLPFYAGWGATTDLVHCARRMRRRTVDELCYIAFVHYTRHVHPTTGDACTIDQLLDALVQMRASRLHQLRVAGLRQFARLCEFVSVKS